MAAIAEHQRKYAEHQRKYAKLLTEFAALQQEVADKQAASAAYMKAYARNTNIAAGLLCLVAALFLLRLFV